MRKEQLFSLPFVLLLLTCLTLTSARALKIKRQSSPQPSAFPPGAFPWDPAVSGIGQGVRSTEGGYDYTLSLTIGKTVTRVALNFTFVAPVSSVTTQSAGWTVEFDGTTGVNVFLAQQVTVGSKLEVTLKIKTAGGFNFPSLLTTTCLYMDKPETQSWPSSPSTGLPPQPTSPGGASLVSTASQGYSSSAYGSYQYTVTFKAFRALDNLIVQFAFPNINVVSAVSNSAGATATVQNGFVVVTYGAIGTDAITTTLALTTTNGLTTTKEFNFTTVTSTGPQTQLMKFDQNPDVPQPTQKPLLFTHLNHGIRGGRASLEIAYYMIITVAANIDKWSAELTMPMPVSSAEGEGKVSATLTGQKL